MKQLFASLSVFLIAASARAEVSPKALSLQDTPWHLPVTNSILTSWIVTLLFLVVARLIIGRIKTVPGRAQGVAETVLDSLKGLYEPIVGKKAMGWSFPVIVTLFFFILIHNWSGLVPGVGTIGWGHGHGDSFLGLNKVHVETPLIRPHTSDFNGTLALALFSFGAWIILILKYAGPKLVMHDIFGNKADRNELSAPIYWGLWIIFPLVGVIEMASILIRPFTLSIRLYGNIFGGEKLMHSMAFIPPLYFMELLVGLIQAVVFTLLTAVYIGLICNHGDEHADDHH